MDSNFYSILCWDELEKKRNKIFGRSLTSLRGIVFDWQVIFDLAIPKQSFSWNGIAYPKSGTRGYTSRGYLFLLLRLYRPSLRDFARLSCHFKFQPLKRLARRWVVPTGGASVKDLSGGQIQRAASLQGGGIYCRRMR